MCGRIRAFLTEWRAKGRPLNLPEVERRLIRCRACSVFEACPHLVSQDWLAILVQGDSSEAATLCESWKP